MSALERFRKYKGFGLRVNYDAWSSAKRYPSLNLIEKVVEFSSSPCMEIKLGLSMRNYVKIATEMDKRLIGVI